MERSSAHDQLDTSLEEGEISPYYQEAPSSQDCYEGYEQQLPSSDREGCYDEYRYQELPSSHRRHDLSYHDRPHEARTSSKRRERSRLKESQVL